jgi:DNA replication and repair protein RecF
MSLAALQATNFRNLQELNLDFSPTCNLFYGENGSGKTSLLEAIYYLGSSRSFRSHLISRVIQYNRNKFSLYGEILKNDASISIGIERILNGESKIRIAGENVSSAAELAKLLPLQLITQNNFTFLNGGPKYKRKFIDWGLFHVEPIFFPLWQEANRALKQRNSALKSNLPYNFLAPWDHKLNEVAQPLHHLRKNYIEKLLPIVNELLSSTLDNYAITIDYYAGWDTELVFKDILTVNLQRDYKTGFTNFGPHKSDLHFTINNIPIQDVLSRGQQKLFIFALYLAQGILLKQLTNKQCIYLIDDLPAELDEKKRLAIIQTLRTIDAQIFVTGLAKEYFSSFINIANIKLFHVEHGNIIQSCC